jgi:hypothetical protein
MLSALKYLPKQVANNARQVTAEQDESKAEFCSLISSVDFLIKR